MRRVSFFCAVIFFVAPLRAADFNPLIIETIVEMPQGGGYARYSQARKLSDLHRTVELLDAAVGVKPAAMRLEVNPGMAAGYSFCSSATYLLFVRVIEKLQAEKRIRLAPSVNREIARIGDRIDVIAGKNDGVGIFGHWNADGPGTAVLFHRLDLGSNFSSFEKARPGDFMKIFWNDKIGKGERGHLVVFLGHNDDGSAVQVWSSNLENSDGSNGYGSMWVERSRIKRVVFSRLEHPENLNRWKEFSKAQRTSDYLVGIRKVSSTPDEMGKATGLED